MPIMVFGRRAGEGAGELRALVFSGDDLAGAAQLPSTDLKKTLSGSLAEAAPAVSDRAQARLVRTADKDRNFMDRTRGKGAAFLYGP